MIRMLLLTMCGVASCTCPVDSCVGRLQVVLAPSWDVGTTVVELTGDGFSATCTFQVPEGAAAPWPSGITCGPDLDRPGYMLDTGGVVEQVVRVSLPLEGSTAPRTVAGRVVVNGVEEAPVSSDVEVRAAAVGSTSSCPTSCEGGVVRLSW